MRSRPVSMNSLMDSLNLSRTIKRLSPLTSTLEVDEVDPSPNRPDHADDEDEDGVLPEVVVEDDEEEEEEEKAESVMEASEDDDSDSIMISSSSRSWSPSLHSAMVPMLLIRDSSARNCEYSSSSSMKSASLSAAKLSVGSRDSDVEWARLVRLTGV